MAAAERPPAPFIGALEGLRGVAALAVVVYHCWVRTGQASLGGGIGRNLVSTGFLGVDVFFVLSGFVLFLPVAMNGELGATGAFWLRRAARLLPAYWFVLILVVAGASLIDSDPQRIWDHVTADSISAHLILMPAAARLVPGYRGALGFGGDPVVWTLTVEALFALVLPLIAATCVRRPWVLGVAAIAGLVLRAVIGAHATGLSAVRQGQLFSLGPPLLTDFALGMGAALLWTRARGRSLERRLGLLALPAAAVLVVAAAALGGAHAGPVRNAAERSLWAGAIVPLAVAVLCTALAAGPQRVLARALGARPVRASGRWSYGIYLGHFPIIGFCVTTLGLATDATTGAWLVMVAVAAPLAVLYGAGSFRFVETPARSWARAWGRRRRARAAAGAQA